MKKFKRESRDISDLQGKTLSAVAESGDGIRLSTECGEVYEMYHAQNCCERVSLESGLDELVRMTGQEIVLAEERTNEDAPPAGAYEDDRSMWTFYTIRSVKDTAVLRWWGTSNGYYSVDVDFEELIEL